MIKKMSKKGFTYLLVASILIAVMLIIFLAAQRYKFQDKQNLQETRIKILNDFVKGFNNDVKRAIYISSFRSFIALEDHVATTKTYLSNTENSFKEVFTYGTINGTKVELLNGSSFKDYLTNVNIIANNIGITTNVSIENVNIIQSDPWNLQVTIFTNISIEDQNGLATWNYTKSFTSLVPIENLRDPLYSTNTENKVPNTIRKTPYSILVNSTNNDTTNLQTHINDSYYISSSNAPSFLMRFENNLSADPNGIESIVNINKLSEQDIPVYINRVKIDYIYFNNLITDKICNIDTIPTSNYFILPSNRITKYQINNLNYSIICP